jgi:hypothetical protein
LRLGKKIGLAIAATCLLLAVIGLWPRLPRVASKTLDRAETYELLSLSPERADAATPGLFHGFRVLGQTTITDRGTQARLNHALARGVESLFTNRPRCFNPRHGIRATVAGQTTDFVICFECEQVQVWRDGERIGDWSTAASPQPIFDEALRQAGVELPKPY